MATECRFWINGESINALDSRDRGLAYGHGLFETLRVCNGAAPLLHYHLQRLQSGAQVLGIPLELDRLEKQLPAFFKEQGKSQGDAGIVKILLTAGVGGRGYQTPEQLQANVILQWHPLPPLPNERLRLRICRHRLPNNPPLAGIKHLNRLDQVLARQEWSDSDIHDGILLDTQGRLVEAVASNLFVWLDDGWVTPKLHRCGVAGVMRRLIMEQLCPALDVAVTERDMKQDELLEASEVILCNSVQGIRSVAAVDKLVNYQDSVQGQRLRRILGEQYSCFHC